MSKDFLTLESSPEKKPEAPKRDHEWTVARIWGDIIHGNWSDIFKSQTTDTSSGALNPMSLSHAPKMVQPGEFVAKANALFDRLDTNKDGSLSTTELAAAMQDNNYKGQDAQIVAALYYARDQLVNPKTAQIDKSSIQYSDAVGAALQRTWTSEVAENNSLYADSNNPIKSINPDAIRQGFCGDCYFEAALSAMAAKHPQAIVDMIKDNHNGTYTVTFPGDAAKPVTVATPTEAERGLFNEGSQYGIWASVIEKAYGSYCQTKYNMRTNLPTEATGNGGFAEGLGILTYQGSGTPEQLSGQDLAALGAELNSRLNTSNPLAMITDKKEVQNTVKVGPVDNETHMFSVMAYDPSGPDGGTVTLRNPWGNKTQYGDYFPISLKNFVKDYDYLVPEARYSGGSPTST